MTDDGAAAGPGGPSGRRGRGGLLAVHAHPDDETLSTGALLATWAAAGRPVTVVTCTRGERGEVIGDHLRHLADDPAALAAHRQGELAAALRALGVTDHTFLDRVEAHPGGRPSPGVELSQPGHRGPGGATRRYSDSGMAWLAPGLAGPVPHRAAGAFVDVALDDAAARLAVVLRDRRPDVVVGYEPGGGYGHPDHVRAHQVMMRAVELAAVAGPDAAGPWPVPVVLWSVLDGTALRRAYRRCARLVEMASGTVPGSASDGPELGAPDPAGALPSAAVDGATIDVRVPLTPVLPAVLGALRAHASQVQAVRTGPDDCPVVFALSNGVLQPMLGTETYRIARRTSSVRWPAAVRVA